MAAEPPLYTEVADPGSLRPFGEPTKAGNPAGCAPGVEATLTCSTPGPGGGIRSNSASSPGPGQASAEADSRRVAGRATVSTRAMGAVAAGSA